MSDADIKFNREMLRRSLDKGTELLLLLEDSKTTTMTDEQLIEKLQALVDEGVLSYYFSLIAFAQAMVRSGKITVPQVTQQGLVIPKGSKTH